MTTVLVFLLLLSPPAMELIFHARRVRERALTTGPTAVGPGAGVDDAPGWSALDDHQLTRLLVSSTHH